MDDYIHILTALTQVLTFVWSLCPCCLDCLEDVHSSFNLDFLSFHHTSDEDTTARQAVTVGKTDNHVQNTRTALCSTVQECTPVCPFILHITRRCI